MKIFTTKKKKSVKQKIDSTLTVGREVQVLFKSDKNTYVYRSSIADFDAEAIYITPISRNGKPGHLRKGESITMLYLGPDAMYEFHTAVVDYVRDNNIMLTKLVKPEEFKRIQRRAYYRLSLLAEGTYRKLSYEERIEGKVFKVVGKKKPCMLHDISGGGLAFHANEELEDASYVEVEFYLPKDKKSKIIFKEILNVLRPKSLPTVEKKDNFEHTYASIFYDIKDNKQAALIKYIMQKQIEERGIS